MRLARRKNRSVAIKMSARASLAIEKTAKQYGLHRRRHQLLWRPGPQRLHGSNGVLRRKRMSKRPCAQLHNIGCERHHPDRAAKCSSAPVGVVPCMAIPGKLISKPRRSLPELAAGPQSLPGIFKNVAIEKGHAHEPLQSGRTGRVLLPSRGVVFCAPGLERDVDHSPFFFSSFCSLQVSSFFFYGLSRGRFISATAGRSSTESVPGRGIAGKVIILLHQRRLEFFFVVLRPLHRAGRSAHFLSTFYLSPGAGSSVYHAVLRSLPPNQTCGRHCGADRRRRLNKMVLATAKFVGSDSRTIPGRLCLKSRLNAPEEFFIRMA